MIITHDAGFLDRVVTHIIHYEDNRKLKNYKVPPRPSCKIHTHFHRGCICAGPREMACTFFLEVPEV